MARSHTPVFALTFTVMHTIDEASPLWRVTHSGMQEQDTELLITVTGLEETTSQVVHARHSYSWDDILWNRRFADIFAQDATGRRYIDYRRFHSTEPASVG